MQSSIYRYAVRGGKDREREREWLTQNSVKKITNLKFCSMTYRDTAYLKRPNAYIWNERLYELEMSQYFVYKLIYNSSLIKTLKMLQIICKFAGRCGIATTRNCTHLLKNALILFVCMKLIFFLTIFLSFSDLFPRKPRIKFWESGCNFVWVQYQLNQILLHSFIIHYRMYTFKEILY